MIKEVAKVNIPLGLHARAASLFVKEANKYISEVFVCKNEKKYNAKSIMGILSLGAKNSDEIEIIANGEDEKTAVLVLKNLLEKELKNSDLV